MYSAMRTTIVAVSAGLATSCWADGGAIGAEPATSPKLEVAAVSKLELPALAILRHNPFDTRPVASGQLASRRGGDGVFNQNKLKGVVADNSASNLTTGMNVISEGAFAGSSGLPTVIQNSGNNVLIQNSTIVNVQVK